MDLPYLGPVHAAIEALKQRLIPVSIERLTMLDAGGRVLAEPLLADRDSPALDVSAMDGYALRIADLGGQPLRVSDTTAAGSPAAVLHPKMAIRIFTGAPVPAEADCVVRREDTTELESAILVNIPASTLQVGQNIRRRGENTRRGDIVLSAGMQIGTAAIAAVASFGSHEIVVRRKVRVSILTTGDELVQPGDAVEDWRIRDSNGPTLQAWLERLPWVELISREQVGDRSEGVRDAIQARLEGCDAILLTGGVSMGDADYVPAAIEQVGGEIVFHRLPIRPGKPILGAAVDGKLLLGLPGNPVSVAVTARVFGLPLLGAMAGCNGYSCHPLVRLESPDDQRIDLIWYRLVVIAEDGKTSLVSSRGSGDLVSLSRSHGFVEFPPERSGPGPWRLTLW